MQSPDMDQFIFNDIHGRTLVRLARKTLQEKLGQKIPAAETDDLRKKLEDPIFRSHRGTFVTLTIDGNLRGCIGSLTATEPIKKNISGNAVNAAFNDPRFPSLSTEELDQIEIEISILTESKPLSYEGGDDLVSKLRVNTDGVIIRKGIASATFLPQVWDQLPKPEDFLSPLCMKAGLSPNAWQKPGLQVSTYQVQYFEEHS